MAVLCTGSVAIDHIMVFRGRFRDVILPDKIHALNVAFHVPELRRSFGGTAANIAFNLRLLGEDPIVLATVGSGFESYARWLDQHRIRRRWIRELPDESTPGAYITTDLEDNQIIGFHAGAMDRAHELAVSEVDESLDLAIVSPNGKQAMIQHARDLKARGIPTVIDPGQGLPLFDGHELIELLTGADTYVVNDYEWSMTLKTTGLSESELADRVGTLVVTRGEHGALLRVGDEQEPIAAVRAGKVVDPTGCGDAWRAGYLFGRRRGLPLRTCAQIGSLMGSLMVEAEGTQTLSFGLDEFRARYEREFGASL